MLEGPHSLDLSFSLGGWASALQTRLLHRPPPLHTQGPERNPDLARPASPLFSSNFSLGSQSSISLRPIHSQTFCGSRGAQEKVSPGHLADLTHLALLLPHWASSPSLGNAQPVARLNSSPFHPWAFTTYWSWPWDEAGTPASSPFWLVSTHPSGVRLDLPGCFPHHKLLVFPKARELSAFPHVPSPGKSLTEGAFC